MAQAKNIPVPVTKFKAQCLEMVETVHRKRTSIIISKRGKPVAKLVPLEVGPAPRLYGSMKGTLREIGDIMAPIEDEWQVNSDD